MARHVAIDDQSQPVDHRDIWNSVDMTWAFRFAEEAARDVSYFYFLFLSFVCENGTEKINYKNFRPFCFYFWLISLSLFIITERKKLSFSYVLHKSVFSTLIIHCTSFLIFNFHGTSDSRKQKTVALLSMNHHRNPRMDQWTIHEIAHCLIDCQYFTHIYDAI